MKRIVLLAIALMISVTAFAEIKVGSYHSSFFGLTYDVEATYTNYGLLSVYIQVAGDSSYDEIYLNLTGDDVDDFVAALKAGKEKFLEWKRIAADNHVTDMTKDFSIEFPHASVCWMGSEWRWARWQRLSPYFRVTESGVCVFVMSEEVEDDNNEYIHTTYYLALSNARDFDELIEAVTPANVKAILDRNQSVQDLFQ